METHRNFFEFRHPLDLTLVLLATVVAVALIVTSLARGTAPGVDLEQTLSIFAAP
jgi:hypothetical protein